MKAFHGIHFSLSRLATSMYVILALLLALLSMCTMVQSQWVTGRVNEGLIERDDDYWVIKSRFVARRCDRAMTESFSSTSQRCRQSTQLSELHSFLQYARGEERISNRLLHLLAHSLLQFGDHLPYDGPFLERG